jgi:hypothetical protein
MNKIIAALLLSLGIASAQAMPIVFTSSIYTTSAFADVDGTSDGPNATASPPDALPLISSANVVVDQDNMATANAVADTLLLAASSEAASAGAISSASAVSTFLGSFTTTGAGLSLQVTLEDFIDALGGATASSELFILLQVDGNDLFQQNFMGPQLINADFMTLAGLPGVLDITLVSTAAANGAGGAFNLASTGISLNSVPEPASLVLVLGGLGLLGASRMAGARRVMG